MYKWNLNSQHARTQQWHGGTVALIGGVVGMLLASAFWWMRSTARSRQYQLPQLQLNRLGQAPSRAHIQLRSHPARQEQPR
jgi:hypothetical protein